jgi:hypothetical protein
MGVNVDETRRHHLARRIDDHGGLWRHFTEFDDSLALDPDIRSARRSARTVNDLAASDNHI